MLFLNLTYSLIFMVINNFHIASDPLSARKAQRKSRSTTGENQMIDGDAFTVRYIGPDAAEIRRGEIYVRNA